MKRVDFTVAAADRLDRVVPAGVPELSRRRARALIAEGAVYLDGKRCKVASRTAPAGARVVVHLAAAAPPPKLEVLFEDTHVVAVNKPAGLPANESETSPRPSVVGIVGGGARLVHRLDLDTTGVMVLARGAEDADTLSAAFRERRVTKRYLAITLGVPPEGWVDAPIGPDPRRPRAFAVRDCGKPARTRVEVVAVSDGLAAVRLELDTGRTHQIRVHLSHLGAPILGDTAYGAKRSVTFEGAPLTVARPLLHAEHLALRAFGVDYAFDAPAPDDLARLWARLRE